MDCQAKKTVLRMFTYGLYMLTVPDGAGGHGCTVNWVTQTSFEPPMVAVSVEKRSHTSVLLRSQRVFAINVLGQDQIELAGRLGRRWANTPDKFRGVSWERGVTGVPLLTEALGYVECRVTSEQDSGDSVLFAAEVVAAGHQRNGAPLTMTAAGFRHAG